MGYNLICMSIKFPCHVNNCNSLVDNLSLSLYISVFSLDPDQKEQLIEVIEKLLKDKSTVSTDRALGVIHCPCWRPLEGAPVKRFPS